MKELLWSWGTKQWDKWYDMQYHPRMAQYVVDGMQPVCKCWACQVESCDFSCISAEKLVLETKPQTILLIALLLPLPVSFPEL